MVVQHGDVIFPIGETHRRFPAAVSHVLQISVLTKTFGQQAGQCLVVFHHKDPERLPGLFTGAYGMDRTFTCRGGNLGLAQHSGKTVILGWMLLHQLPLSVPFFLHTLTHRSDNHFLDLALSDQGLEFTVCQRLYGLVSHPL